MNRKRYLPKQARSVLRCIYNWRDLVACCGFIVEKSPGISIKAKLKLVWRIYKTSICVASPHKQEEILAFIRAILALPETSSGVIVEAGCFKGSSSAKFSLAAQLKNREFIIFDSFEGIPENDEPHDLNIFGGRAVFKQGDYAGALSEVAGNIQKYGNATPCQFVKGWFEETLPDFNRPVAAAYIDVDLASSTRTCLKYLYPLLEPGGVLISQDGHLPLVIDVLSDERFWLDEVGCKKPPMEGIGKKKIVTISKPLNSQNEAE
jgi:O-methyltransferase